ncbi:MAG: alpha-L-arabinofuranosidase C-terminal domain-containing protein [Bacteroidota bacterium]|nr:alpha-L-arabinofuranosidase C-terminal domain-containing protein [Bacteroidota bacterium]MDP4217236.1 alpha-L-arabinofuranosidase C-terminal domain-containing protein [Bacteroidota bacterium]MDP4246005.1 alpha-L-arabinofuranosidase C-terminal domain-containing protein [Bacteroidota bacterium]MDP4255989.1 alpha-L-arabinofuranosidase C-terminal domain-containing protein [Bacteroidota bacterium]MDP4260402.1 alpha-L-arabinofuranosidase C-terminal domain-containing protein [Bacteroidota bacterium
MRMKVAALAFLLLVAMTGIQAQQSTLTIRDTSGPVISRFVYGHFSEHLGRCIYDGFWTGDKIRMDIVDALKKIKVPMLRWPGGCFADQYHWRDAIGPRDQRKKTVNTTWGMVTEDNSFGTHEYLELCHLIGCEPYIAGNVGSGTPEEMSNWLEYLNFNGKSTLADLRRQNGRDQPWNVSFWGVGNESWGCGGNMTPEYYSTQYRRYAEFCKNYPGAPLKLIASGANGDDYNWTEVLMKNIPLRNTWGISMHYYTIARNWQHKGSATQFGEDDYFSALANCLRMEELVSKNSVIMNKYDPAKKVALVVDEWGIWTDPEPGTNPAFLYQQNSLRDALIAASTLNIFNNHCDRVKMAALAQTVNVLQSLILTDKDKMLLTPTYHVFDLYKVHQDAKLLPVQLESPDYVYGSGKIPAVNASASRDASGLVHISLVNLDPAKKVTVRTELKGISWNGVEGRILTSANFTDVNTFDHPDKVKPAAFTGAKKEGGQLVVEMPPHSVVVLELK